MRISNLQTCSRYIDNYVLFKYTEFEENVKQSFVISLPIIFIMPVNVLLRKRIMIWDKSMLNEIIKFL